MPQGLAEAIGVVVGLCLTILTFSTLSWLAIAHPGWLAAGATALVGGLLVDGWVEETFDARQAVVP